MKLTEGQKAAFADDIRKAFERKEHLEDREQSEITDRVITGLRMRIDTYIRVLSILGYGYNLERNSDGYTVAVTIVPIND
ncbi:hypothetical protein IKE71_03780 [Candidatus Saccharibacteria bacterium]|nr:hypothetical protein [Candidatus Saccharibacteria bacterium]